MERINSVNARPDVNGLGKRGFHDNEDLPGQDATYLTPSWLNTIQEELCGLLEKHGIQLDPNDSYQLYKLLATDSDLLALAEAVEQRIIGVIALMATKSALNQAIDYVAGNLQQHKDAKNPHPQYLLASTFGVDLLMAASTETPIDDAHNVFGWDGSAGITSFSTGTISWHKSRSGTISFKPFRAYGEFLFNADITTADEYRFTFKVYNAQDALTQTFDSAIYYSGGYRSRREQYVFILPKGGRVEIDWYIRAGGVKKTDFRSAIYVDDRPVAFSPVGYTSVANSSNDSGTSSDVVDDGYNIYPNYTWFYYSNMGSEYIQLSNLSTLASPVLNTPHFHRTKFAGVHDTELWVVLEAALQTVELPTSDYSPVDVQVLRASTDEDGDVVVEIPFAMRNIETPNNETLVYTIAYYSTEVTKTIEEDNFPENSMDGQRKIFVRP